MKADFSRDTFDPDRQYSSVRLQQGRVQVDADWNEGEDIVRHYDRTARIDEVGPSGAPLHDAGFALAIDGVPTVGPGRYYVDGILVDQTDDDPVPLDDQPWLPGAPLPTSDGIYAAVLDVHERLVTPLQDADLREVALGGADHAVRTQIVWQVRLIRVGDLGDDVDCDAIRDNPDWDEWVGKSSGEMRARLAPADNEVDPCVVPKKAGYRGLDNQLYRVEIHEGSWGWVDGVFQKVNNKPTYKWSRENGSVQTSWAGPDAASAKVQVGSVGRDDRLGFAAGQWVELTGDTHELNRAPGALRTLTGVDNDTLEFQLDSAGPSRPGVGDAPRIVRWEGDGAYDVKGAYQDLERGVQVLFNKNNRYQTGDYWLVPARVLTGELGWDDPQLKQQHGPVHHHSLLGIVELSGGTWSLHGDPDSDDHDCRPIFPPATELGQMHYLGGDGQEPGEDGWAPRPLRVGVSNGTAPVAGTRVRFTPMSGRLTEASDHSGAAAVPLQVLTDADGVAEVYWQVLDGPIDHETRPIVVAEWLDHAGQPRGLAIHFAADVDPQLEYVGGDGQDALPGGELAEPLTVQVVTGGWAVPDALVEFQIRDVTQGSIMLGDGTAVNTTVTSGRVTTIQLRTDAEGKGSVRWRVGTAPTHPRQVVTARLLEQDADPTHDHVFFNGTIRRARDTHFDARCPNLRKAHTVADALDTLCRNATLSYVGGDGQVGRPGEVLPLSLRVRVANGNWPREGVFVRFEVLNRRAYGRSLGPKESGLVKGMNPVPWGRGGGAGEDPEWSDTYVVQTDANGEAQAQWMLGTESRLDAQRVRVQMLTESGLPTGAELIYNAAVSSSDPAMRLVATDGSWSAIEPQAVLPLLDFRGIRFLDILAEPPPEKTHPTEWWPGVEVRVAIPTDEDQSTWGELLVPGITTAENGNSLFWQPGAPIGGGAAAATMAAPSAPLGPMVAMLDRSLRHRPELMITGTGLTRSPSGVLVRAPAGAASAGPAAATDGPQLTRLPMRIKLTPSRFPGRCAGRAPDFETFFWLELRS